jgi:hypothetical protein
VNTTDLATALAGLMTELVDGAPETAAYILNRGDPGLLRSLDRLSAAAASAVVPGGSSVAAHTEHLRYGLSLMNRWAVGDDPFADADWTQSWRKTTVSDSDWRQLRAELRDETHRWMRALRTPRAMDQGELNGMVATVAHLAYHLGAIRQIDRATRGPSAND